MASTVLSGSANPTYTNNTGQNVRVVINFMTSYISNVLDKNRGTIISTTYGMAISWAGVAASYSSTTTFGIGRNIASFTYSYPSRIDKDGFTVIYDQSVSISSNNAAVVPVGSGSGALHLPTEIMLAPGQTFSATCSAYNIVVIPEAG